MSKALVLTFASTAAWAACTLTTGLDGLAGEPVGAQPDSTSDSDASPRDGPPPDVSGVDAPDSSPGDRYRAEVLRDMPLGYWRLGETSGTTAADETRQHDGLYVGNVNRGVVGAIVGSTNTAARFGQGTVAIGDFFDFPGLAAFAIEAWLLYDHPFDASGHGQQAFVSKQLDGSGQGGYFGFLDREGFLRLERLTANANVYEQAMLGFTPSASFRHVVLSFDGKTCYVHLDGVPAASSPCSLQILDTITPFIIGGGANPDGPFAGSIDEVAVYAGALPTSRVKRHFDVGRGLP